MYRTSASKYANLGTFKVSKGTCDSEYAQEEHSQKLQKHLGSAFAVFLYRRESLPDLCSWK